MRPSRFHITAFAVVAVALFGACSGPTDVQSIPVVQIGGFFGELTVGDTAVISLLPMLPPGYVPQVTWTTSDATVLSLEMRGSRAVLARALSAGDATVKAAGDGVQDSVVVTVQP